ncbi:MAG: hypothetical protein ACR2RE_01850, partial [Geminicoccaceae bacterium]
LDNSHKMEVFRSFLEKRGGYESDRNLELWLHPFWLEVSKLFLLRPIGKSVHRHEKSVEAWRAPSEDRR